MSKVIYILIGFFTTACGGLSLDNRHRDILEETHMKTLRNFTYKNDIDLYGVSDKWVSNCNEGDCEDYSLCMYGKVGGEILIVKTKEGESHTVLDVNGTIIDSLSWYTYKLEDMKHTLVVRIPEGNVVYSKY